MKPDHNIDTVQQKHVAFMLQMHGITVQCGFVVALMLQMHGLLHIEVLCLLGGPSGKQQVDVVCREGMHAESMYTLLLSRQCWKVSFWHGVPVESDIPVKTIQVKETKLTGQCVASVCFHAPGMGNKNLHCVQCGRRSSLCPMLTCCLL